jgi:O-antigen ligase
MLLRFMGRESGVALLLCALLFWAPLPAGSVTPAGQLVFRLAACGLFLLAFGPGAGRRPFGLLPVAAVGALAALGFLQSCPMPAAAAAAVSPEHARLSIDEAQLVQAAERPALIALSLDPSVTRSAALSWLATAALLAVALVAGRRSDHRRWLLAALVAAALVQVGSGLIRLQASSPAGLGAVLLRPEGRLRGTFANPNHVSLLLEIAMMAVTAWAWVELSRLRRRRLDRPVRALVPMLVWLVLLGGVVLTGSRAGLVAAALGTVVQVVALPAAARGRKARFAALLVFLLGLAGLACLVAVGSGLEIRRYETVSVFETNLRSRFLLTAPALELWRRFPLTGTGLGTFEDAFPMVTPSELSPVLWNRAHNDPLELLVTGGIVGLAVGLVALAALVPQIWRALRQGEKIEDRAAGIAALGALVAVGLHELTDFGLVIPANALALLAILGSAMAAGSAVRGTHGSAEPARD